jgi:HSP20 family protein
MNPLVKRTNRWIDPFDLVTDLQDDMARLFSAPLRREPKNGFVDFFPNLEVKEDENQYILHLDVPGMERKDLDISVVGNTLTVKGERKTEEHKKEKGYFYSERQYGSFQRSVELPTEVESDKVAANYKDGVLELTLPKSEKAKPKQIKVDVK